MKLFEPGRIGRLTLKNRIVMSPMGIGELIQPDGRLSQRGLDYYAARAKGGTGLIISCMSRVSQEIERLADMHRLHNVMLDDSKYIPRLSEWAETLHDYGAKLAIQLTPGVGRIMHPEYLGADGPVGPSPLSCFWAPSVITRELTTEEVERLVLAFEFSAGIASAAGADAIEIHGHTGYLLDQFTTSLWNKRTDKYSGNLEGRLRFAVEIIEAIKRGAGADFPVIYRLSLTHYLEGGREIEEGLEMARRLEAAGLDAIDIDAGCYETMYWAFPPTTQPRGCWVDLAEMVKKVVSIPVMVGGKLGYPELAEKVLEEGKADFIVLGRPLLADPEWANKVKERKLEDIRPCIGDNEGCIGQILDGKDVSCVVNPVTGMERELVIKPAERKKSVLVIGGGPGGMEAARIMALRGHKVTLYEKGYALGGNLILVSIPDFKQDYRRLINYLSTQIKKLGVTIKLGKEATLELIQEIKPDAVVLATGGVSATPQIPGSDRDNVVSTLDLRDMLKGCLKWSTTKEKKGCQKILWFAGNIFARFLKPSVMRWLARLWLPFGKRVVIIGGSHGECELALYLAQKGKKVTIVEISDSVATEVFISNQMHLLKLLAEANVEILTDTNVLEITDEGIAIADKDGKKSTLEVDTVVIAVDLKPDGRLLEALKDKVPEVYAIGDCVEPLKSVVNAIGEGFRTARLV